MSIVNGSYMGGCKEIEIKCKCGHTWNYRPRDPNHIPKYPHSRCSKCHKRIAIKRTKLIKSDNWRKIGDTKHVRKIAKDTKLVENLEILELLGKGYYAQEIVQKGSISKGNLSKIINSFKSRKLIDQIQSYPKRYKLTIIGNLFLDQGDQGDLAQTRIQEFISDKNKPLKLVPPLRGHGYRFSNELIQKPSWLNQIRDRGFINGLAVRRVRLHNWNKFLIFFSYQDFNGLDNIEICNKVIVYNFKQKIKDQLISSPEHEDKLNEDRILNCEKARLFLQEKGFSIGQETPVRCQRPGYASTTNGETEVARAGKDIIITIKTPTGDRIIDDSPKVGGEEETTDFEKVKSYFDIPKEVAGIKEAYLEVNERISEILKKTDLTNLETKISRIIDAQLTMANAIEKITETITSLVKPQEQETKENTEAGGMYR